MNVSPVSDAVLAPPRPQSTSRRAWGALTALALALVPHVIVYGTTSESAAFRFAAAAMIALALIGAGVGVWGWRGTPRVAAVRARLGNGWRTPYIGAAILVGVVYGFNARPEWVYAHTGLTLALLFTLVYAALFDGVPRVTRLGWIGIAAGALIVTFVRLNALSYYPIYNIVDESWILGWAISYLRDGYFHDLINYYGGADIQRFMLPVAWWVSVFGTGFWETRLFFFICSMGVIGLGGLAARRLYGNAWITVLVMFASAVVMSGARIRHDVGLALAIAASIWLWSEADKRERTWLHGLAGLMIGVGMFAHYHATFMGAALFLGLYAPRWIQSRRLTPDRGVIAFIAGGLIGVVLFVLLQVLPDWQGFLSVRRVRNSLTHLTRQNELN